MRKGERTRHRIVRRAAGIFNRKGYEGAAISDVMEATGLEKGGIYRHFDSKDELALQAFEYAVHLVNSHYLQAIRSATSAPERLKAVVEAFSQLQHGSPIAGGCPIMNTAIDSDDGHPRLRRRARQAVETWHDMLSQVVARGIERGEVRADVLPEEVATALISLMEGGLMMARITDDDAHYARVLTSLHSLIDDLRPQ